LVEYYYPIRSEVYAWYSNRKRKQIQKTIKRR
jgi:hypothetical protein